VTDSFRFNSLLNQFSTRKIIVVGDLIADQFIFGGISRVSREAPVFILRHEETQTIAGGAANCAVNVASLNATSVLIGVLGDDSAGNTLIENLAQAKVETGFVIRSKTWQTTTKVRIFAGQTHAPRQQVIRLDYENNENLNAEIEAELIENLRQVVGLRQDRAQSVATNLFERMGGDWFLVHHHGSPLMR